MRFLIPALLLGLIPVAAQASPTTLATHGASPSVKIQNYRATQYNTTRRPHKDLRPLAVGEFAPDLGWLSPGDDEIVVLVGLSPYGGACNDEIRTSGLPHVPGKTVRMIGIVLDPAGNRWDGDDRYWVGNNIDNTQAIARWQMNSGTLSSRIMAAGNPIQVVDTDLVDGQLVVERRWISVFGAERMDREWEQRVGYPVFHDDNQMIASTFGIQSPCEVAIINDEGMLAYSGPIRTNLSRSLASVRVQQYLLPASRRFMIEDPNLVVYIVRDFSRSSSLWDTNQDGFPDPNQMPGTDNTMNPNDGEEDRSAGHLDDDPTTNNPDDDGDY